MLEAIPCTKAVLFYSGMQEYQKSVEADHRAGINFCIHSFVISENNLKCLF